MLEALDGDELFVFGIVTRLEGQVVVECRGVVQFALGHLAVRAGAEGAFLAHLLGKFEAGFDEGACLLRLGVHNDLELG